ncbi:MAG: phosphonate ABC transporter, permease protein PhnE, partial [Reinekea forsetii]|nr:phosphonate ABC transporter, permease protein PhnE [Reinekea forsetii]
MAGLESTDAQYRQNPFKRNWLVTGSWLVLAGYLVFSFNAMGLTWDRFIHGLGIADQLMARMFPPNFSRWELLLSGLAESMEIAIIASVVGIFLSLFFGLFAARNLMPTWVNVPMRGFIALC